GSGRFDIHVEANLASAFLKEWASEGPLDGLEPAANYAIDLSVADPATVVLKGRLSGETVRITLSFEGDDVYTSDKAGHARYVYHHRPTQCPNESTPAWFAQFIDQNYQPQ